MAATLKAAIYCRVSTEEQAREGFSIAAQKKTLIEFSKMKNWEVSEIYADEGISGKHTRRPGFQRLLDDAKKQKFSVVLVWKINRFSRKNRDLLNTVEYLKEYGVDLISYSEQFDTSTPVGKLMLSMLGSIGEFERDTIIENIKAGMAERARQGLFNGGRIFGYESSGGKLVINENEAQTVKLIFKLFLSGNSYSSIKKILQAEGCKTLKGADFQITTIRRILKNPVYAGYITYNKTTKVNNRIIQCQNPIICPGKHDAIIDKNDFDRVQEIINSKSAKKYSRRWQAVHRL